MLTDPYELISDLARALTASMRDADRLEDELSRLHRDGVSISRRKNHELSERCEALVARAWREVAEADKAGV